MINLKFSDAQFEQAFLVNEQDTISLIFSLPGSGKTALLNALNLYSYQKTLNPLFIIDLFNCQRTILTEINDNDKNILTFGEQQRNFINPLDITFGFDFPNSEDLLSLRTFLSSVFYADPEINFSFTKKDKETEELIQKIISTLYKNKKYYTRGEHKQVDYYLEKLNIYNSKISWFTLRNIFISNHLTGLAHFCHSQAMHVLNDIMLMLKSDKQHNISRYEYILNKYITAFPFFNQNTNVFRSENKKLHNFNLENTTLSQRNSCSATLVFSIFLYKMLSWQEITKENYQQIRSLDIKKYVNQYTKPSVSPQLIINEFQQINNNEFCHLFYNHITSKIKNRKNMHLILSTLILSDISENILLSIDKLYMLSYTKALLDKEILPLNSEQILSFIKNDQGFCARQFDNEDYGMNVMIITKNNKNNFEYNKGHFSFDIFDYWTLARKQSDSKIVEKLSLLFHTRKIKEILVQDYPSGKIADNDTPKKIAQHLINKYL